MKKIQARADEFDCLCTGHDEYLVPGELLQRVIAICEAIISGDLIGEAIELPPVFGDTHAMRACGKDFAIAYRPGKLI